MSPRRRALLLLGLAIVLGTLAAGDIGRREAELRSAVGPTVPVVVAARDISADAPISSDQLAVRRVPRRYAPQERVADARELVGLRAQAAVPRGSDLTLALVQSRDPLRLAPGERIADIVATGDRRLVRPGGRVDVLVTREQQGRGGATRLALENAEVLRVADAPAADGDDSGGRIAVALRVRLRQAIYLTAAQNFATELRVLPRAEDDARAGDGEGLTTTSDLDGVR